MNKFREEDVGKHWGYPYCWTEFLLPEETGGGQGTVWAWPSFLSQGVTDEQCRNDFVAPVLSMQAHSAPLGITFYDWKPSEELPDECDGTTQFPQEMDGYAFIAYHGSWNRDIPTGYKVVYVPMDSNGDPLGDPIDLLAHEPPNAKWEDGFRPVDVDFDDCGRLFVSSDGTGSIGSVIVRLEYHGGSPSIAPTYVPTSNSTGGTAVSNSPSSAVSNSPSSMPSILPTACPCVILNSSSDSSDGSSGCAPNRIQMTPLVFAFLLVSLLVRR